MDKLTRRHALTGVAANLLLVKPGTAFGSSANSAISFGIIGTGGRGSYVGTHMAHDPRTRLTAICDIYPDRIDKAKTSIPGGDKARVYRDYKELLAQTDIDVVLIAGMAPGVWEIWRAGMREHDDAAVAPESGLLRFDGKPGSYFLRAI